MPITWTSENVSRLFLVTLAVHHIHMDYKQIARAFGGDASPRAIEEKMKKLRKEARDIGGSSTYTRKPRKSASSSSSADNSDVLKPKGGGGVSKRRGRPKKMASKNEDDSEVEEEETKKGKIPGYGVGYGDLMAEYLVKKEMEKEPDHSSFSSSLIHPKIEEDAMAVTVEQQLAQGGQTHVKMETKVEEYAEENVRPKLEDIQLFGVPHSVDGVKVEMFDDGSTTNFVNSLPPIEDDDIVETTNDSVVALRNNADVTMLNPHRNAILGNRSSDAIDLSTSLDVKMENTLTTGLIFDITDNNGIRNNYNHNTINHIGISKIGGAVKKDADVGISPQAISVKREIFEIPEEDDDDVIEIFQI